LLASNIVAGLNEKAIHNWEETRLGLPEKYAQMLIWLTALEQVWLFKNDNWVLHTMQASPESIYLTPKDNFRQEFGVPSGTQQRCTLLTSKIL
jgi:hypothetical protein